MKLPYSITSDYCYLKRKLPKIDFKEFKKLAYFIAIRTGDKIEKVEEDAILQSYYYAQFKDKNRALLCNAHYPFVTFVKNFRESNFGTIFVSEENEFIANLIRETYYFQYLPQSVLETELTPEILSNLDKVEKEEIKYWKSKTIGEVIFNYYD